MRREEIVLAIGRTMMVFIDDPDSELNKYRVTALIGFEAEVLTIHVGLDTLGQSFKVQAQYVIPGERGA